MSYHLSSHYSSQGVKSPCSANLHSKIFLESLHIQMHLHIQLIFCSKQQLCNWTQNQLDHPSPSPLPALQKHILLKTPIWPCVCSLKTLGLTSVKKKRSLIQLLFFPPDKSLSSHSNFNLLNSFSKFLNMLCAFLNICI